MVSAKRMVMNNGQQAQTETIKPVQPVFAGRRAPLLGHYVFVDYATQIYVALVALIVLLGHNTRVHEWPMILLAHGIGLILIHLLIQLHARHSANPLLDFLRCFYPILCYTVLYSETGMLNQMFHAGYLDPHFLRLERRLFGWEPGLELMNRFPSLWLSEILYAAYFSYYLMIGGIGLALLLRNRRQFAHFVSVVSFVFYVCYLIYIFMPVVGPRILCRDIVTTPLPPDVVPAIAPDTPDAVASGIFYQIMAWIYAHFETPGAAFPSSHVAIAICTAYFSFRYLRPIRWVHLVLVALLCVATIYGHYHYVVDVVAGGLTAALLIPLGNRLFFKFQPDTPG
ncbi:MAG TPA: phosphatase PAP2 family protein [Verrucomicrobiae bacterium]|nr:phosphatase PAP2 family protein [Verrucomicrobiae bacterium]